MNVQQEIYRLQSSDQTFTPPKTPPHNGKHVKVVHQLPEPETENTFSSKRRKIDAVLDSIKAEVEEFSVPHQEILLLHGAKQKYTHTKEQPVPILKNDREMLVSIEVVGLNPIDWKAPYVFDKLNLRAID